MKAVMRMELSGSSGVTCRLAGQSSTLLLEKEWKNKKERREGGKEGGKKERK